MNPLLLIAGLYGGVSLVTFIAYGLDKRAAKRGRSRIPEAWLHGLELLGGWPGAFVGQRLFRHKTRKTSYQIVFWLIGALHVAAWAAWIWLRTQDTNHGA